MADSHASSRLKIFGNPEVIKLYNDRYRITVRCDIQAKHQDWYYDNRADLWRDFGDLYTAPLTIDDAGSGWQPREGEAYPDQVLTQTSLEFIPQRADPVLVLIYETLTSTFVQEADDKIDFELNGLKRLTRTLIATEAASYSSVVGTTTLVDGAETLTLAGYSEDDKGEDEGGYTRIEEIWMEPGILSKAFSAGPESIPNSREHRWRAIGVEPTGMPGIIIGKEETNIEGFITYTYTSLSDINDGDPTDGVLSSYEESIEVRLPGLVTLKSYRDPAYSPQPPLNFASAEAAYSLRYLGGSLTAFGGVLNVVRVRRDSDDAERDFTADQLASGTLAAWVGAHNGFVTKWYDQSTDDNNNTIANACHAVQTDKTKQPKIVDAGTYLEAVVFDGVDDYLESEKTWGISGTSDRSFFSVINSDDVTTTGRPYASIGSNTAASSLQNWQLTSEHGLRVEGGYAVYGGGVAGSDQINSQMFSGSDVWDNDSYLDGAAQNVTSTVEGTINTDDTVCRIGRDGTNGVSSSSFYDGKVKELIVHSSVFSEYNRQRHEWNMSYYYEIPLNTSDTNEVVYADLKPPTMSTKRATVDVSITTDASSEAPVAYNLGDIYTSMVTIFKKHPALSGDAVQFGPPSAARVDQRPLPYYVRDAAGLSSISSNITTDTNALRTEILLEGSVDTDVVTSGVYKSVVSPAFQSIDGVQYYRKVTYSI